MEPPSETTSLQPLYRCILQWNQRMHHPPRHPRPTSSAPRPFGRSSQSHSVSARPRSVDTMRPRASHHRPEAAGADDKLPLASREAPIQAPTGVVHGITAEPTPGDADQQMVLAGPPAHARERSLSPKPWREMQRLRDRMPVTAMRPPSSHREQRSGVPRRPLPPPSSQHKAAGARSVGHQSASLSVWRFQSGTAPARLPRPVSDPSHSKQPKQPPPVRKAEKAAERPSVGAVAAQQGGRVERGEERVDGDLVAEEAGGRSSGFVEQTSGVDVGAPSFRIDALPDTLPEDTAAERFHLQELRQEPARRGLLPTSGLPHRRKGPPPDFPERQSALEMLAYLKSLDAVTQKGRPAPAAAPTAGHRAIGDRPSRSLALAGLVPVTREGLVGGVSEGEGGPMPQRRARISKKTAEASLAYRSDYSRRVDEREGRFDVSDFGTWHFGETLADNLADKAIDAVLAEFEDRLLDAYVAKFIDEEVNAATSVTSVPGLRAGPADSDRLN
ncbi:unnamed protein product [Vitrella brassicaformis CCMP3155]|uniref:Uncharacterized protein n=1 Tax=Vitrella brassicaformis (strain CCMP3155) TaxID=1169540 RepID=A0A0G4GDX6_VITBC|nr:unnamed protein product [Vitrella brassicaformis CCMP3155]|eukprot:CEM27525.1 unnamed protein product [Vitrella brassicaformis CCMP3155]